MMRKGKSGLWLATANGEVKTDLVVPLQSEGLDESIEAHVLDGTPADISVGTMCVENGLGVLLASW